MALGRCSWTQLEGKRQSTKKEMKHFVSPNRASAFYSVLICRGQSECWPGRADQVVSLQASRMRQLFKSSCLDLQFQPVDQHSIKRVLPGTRQRCGFYTDEQEHSSPKEMQMQGKKEKKKTPCSQDLQFLGQDRCYQSSHGMCTTVYGNNSAKLTQAWQANDKAQDPGKMEF